MRNLHSFTRRGLMALAAIGLLAGQSAVHAQAGKFPDRPVKLIVTYPPGGSSDLMARVMGQKLSEIWGQPVVIESKPGAAGSIGMEFAARRLGFENPEMLQLGSPFDYERQGILYVASSVPPPGRDGTDLKALDELTTRIYTETVKKHKEEEERLHAKYVDESGVTPDDLAWRDAWGIPIGVASQLVLVNLVMWPLREAFPDAFDPADVERRARGLVDAPSIVADVYADVPREVWPAAEVTVQAQLEYLGLPAQEVRS